MGEFCWAMHKLGSTLLCYVKLSHLPWCLKLYSKPKEGQLTSIVIVIYVEWYHASGFLHTIMVSVATNTFANLTHRTFTWPIYSAPYEITNNYYVTGHSMGNNNTFGRHCKFITALLSYYQPTSCYVTAIHGNHDLISFKKCLRCLVTKVTTQVYTIK